MISGLDVPLAGGFPVGVPSVLTTSTARSPGVPVGHTLTVATMRLEFNTLTLATEISFAWMEPTDFATLASGGEITTRAPGRKFVPVRVRRNPSVPWVAMPVPALVSVGGRAPHTRSPVETKAYATRGVRRVCKG